MRDNTLNRIKVLKDNNFISAFAEYLVAVEYVKETTESDNIFKFSLELEYGSPKSQLH